MDNKSYIKQEEHRYPVFTVGSTQLEKGHGYEKTNEYKGSEKVQEQTVTPSKQEGTTKAWTHMQRWLLIIIGIGILAVLTGILFVLLKRDTDAEQSSIKPTFRPTGEALMKGPETFSRRNTLPPTEKTAEQPKTDPTAIVPDDGPSKATYVMSCHLDNENLRPSENNRNYLKPSDVCWFSENQFAALTEHYLVIVNVDRKNKICEYARSYHIRGVVATRLACSSDGYAYAKVDSWHNRGIRAATNLTYGRGWYPRELESYIKQYTVSTDSILIESGNYLYIYDLQRRFKERLPIEVDGPPSYGPAYLSADGVLWRTTTVIGSTGLWVYDIHRGIALFIDDTHTYGVTGVGPYVLLPDYSKYSILVYSQWGQFYRELQMDKVVQKPVNVAAVGKTLAVIPDGTWNIEIFDLK